MDILNKIFSLSGMTVVIFGAFLIAAVGYALGRITIKGVSLGTAGVFLVALLFGYLFTLTGLTDIPVLKNFFIENAAAANVKYYKMLESLGLVLFVTSVGFIAGPSFFPKFEKKRQILCASGRINRRIGCAYMRFVFFDSGNWLTVWHGNFVWRSNKYPWIFCSEIGSSGKRRRTCFTGSCGCISIRCGGRCFIRPAHS